MQKYMIIQKQILRFSYLIFLHLKIFSSKNCYKLKKKKGIGIVSEVNFEVLLPAYTQKGFVKLKEHSKYSWKIQGWLAACCNYCMNVQRQGNCNKQKLYFCAILEKNLLKSFPKRNKCFNLKLLRLKIMSNN